MLQPNNSESPKSCETLEAAYEKLWKSLKSLKLLEQIPSSPLRKMKLLYPACCFPKNMKQQLLYPTVAFKPDHQKGVKQITQAVCLHGSFSPLANRWIFAFKVATIQTPLAKGEEPTAKGLLITVPGGIFSSSFMR